MTGVDKKPDLSAQFSALQVSQQTLLDLAAELQATEDWMALRTIILSLYKQMCSHFELEAVMMQQTAYPAEQQAAHLAQHQLLLERLDDRSMDVGKGRMNKQAIVSVMQDWAHQHVSTFDANLIHSLTSAA